MRISLDALALGFISLPSAIAWGSLGHITTAYVATHFLSNTTAAHFRTLLTKPSDPTPAPDSDDYLARIATWADSVRYTRWGRFSKNFHFIDAHDDPPRACDVDLARDCKADGCVVSALANYTAQALDPDLPDWLRAQAAKFVVHFVGDLHQPLHNEDVARGGNGIHVLFDGKAYNLHHVWDTSIAEKWLGGQGLHGKPFPLAEKWANQLAIEITDGRFADQKDDWLKDLDFANATSTALAWSRECNALVCSHVFPEGPKDIAGKELGGSYFEKAGPVVEKQVARAGYRMAVWLDHIADEFQARMADTQMTDEL